MSIVSSIEDSNKCSSSLADDNRSKKKWVKKAHYGLNLIFDYYLLNDITSTIIHCKEVYYNTMK